MCTETYMYSIFYRVRLECLFAVGFIVLVAIEVNARVQQLYYSCTNNTGLCACDAHFTRRILGKTLVQCVELHGVIFRSR